MRAIHLVSGILLAACLCVSASAAGVKGDLNGDNWVNDADAMLLGQAIVENITLSDETAALADMNSDGLLNVQDLMLWYVFQQAYYTVPRVRCLYNGYLLTVNPWTALSPASTADRHRLYVLHAVLIHPVTGRIIGVYPALPGQPGAGPDVAAPADQYPALLNMEQPPAPGVTQSEVIAYWHAQGIADSLLTEGVFINLNGAVATPGLIDDHMHISVWAKKLPAPGERFGYFADVSDPAFYVDPSDWERVCERDTMWRIVTAANDYLADEGKDSVVLHGYWSNSVESIAADPSDQNYLFARTADCAAVEINPDFLLNRIGVGAGAPTEPPADPCESDPGTWPPLTYPTAPAVMVQTSGQSCWYNAPIIDRFNELQEQTLGTRFGPIPAGTVTPPADSGADWDIAVPGASPDIDALFSLPIPSFIDLVVEPAAGGGALTVPFSVVSRDTDGGHLFAQPILAEVADAAFAGPPQSVTVIPYYRSIVRCVSKSVWDDALAWWGESPGDEPLASGRWDPRHPYATNWYNGAQVGLLQYFYDAGAQAWRPTGYAEHYVMRDMLAATILPPESISEYMEERRSMAAWCHRHGLTGANDIMYYRRRYATDDFDAYKALSYDHRFCGGDSFFDTAAIDPAEQTGHFNLRVGLYYYLENPADIDEILYLAHNPATGSDVDRLKPPDEHPESPGWVRWLGWKLQLDGGVTSRTLFSSAPFMKASQLDGYATVTETGTPVTFWDHSFGLFTFVNAQEQVFTSRESAALYWLVRETETKFFRRGNALSTDWSFLRNGVVDWLHRPIDTAALAADLDGLSHVDFAAPDGAARLADKLAAVGEQAATAWETLLETLARIWYAKCAADPALPEMPSQAVCHCAGDGAVDLWVNAIKQLKTDLGELPATWDELPAWWQRAVPVDADLGAVARTFQNERYRVEHLTNVSYQVFADVIGPGGINADTTPASRNIGFSFQPGIFALDGQGSRTSYAPLQELWDIPHDGYANFWRGLPAVPRYHHLVATPLVMAADIPFTLNTDPPAMRDPRPALTVIGAVARTPLEIDPYHWLDQDGPEPEFRPADYLVGRVYGPFGLTAETPDNPMHMTIEETLGSMTFWAAYVAKQETEVGAIAALPPAAGSPGWFADIVVWRNNPLAIQGPGGLTLEMLSQMPDGMMDAARVAAVNAFIAKFRPAMTMVAGLPVYVHESKK